MTKAILILGFAGVLAAQSNWDEVRALKAGTKVRIELKSGGPRVDGRLELVSETGLSVNARQIERTNVRKVSKRVGRGRNIGVGAAIGAAGGAGTAGIMIAAEDPDFSYSIIVGAFAALGALIGAGIGAVIPQHQTVYQAP